MTSHVVGETATQGEINEQEEMIEKLTRDGDWDERV